MNHTLALEPLSGTFVTIETPSIPSVEKKIFETETGPAKDVLPVRWPPGKFEEAFEALIPILSIVYLIGAFGFGGLLIFNALSR